MIQLRFYIFEVFDMKRKFFGSESSLQRQFIASGLTGVFALSAIGSSYAGAMYDYGYEKGGTMPEESKYKVLLSVGIPVLLLVVAAGILLPTVVFLAWRSKKTETKDQKEQGSDKSGESSSADDQEKNEDQEPSDDQGEKGNNKRLLAAGGVVASGTALTVGGVVAKNMMGNKKGVGKKKSSDDEYLFIKGRKLPKSAEDTNAGNSEAQNENSAAGKGTDGDLAVEKKEQDKVDVLNVALGEGAVQGDVKKDEPNVENKGDEKSE